MNEKRCGRCRKVLPVDQFVKNASRVDGLASYCKPCNREYSREVNQRPHIKEQRRRARKVGGIRDTNRYFAKYPYKRKAQLTVQAAVKSGKLIRPENCENCGEAIFTEAHHDDYGMPLAVRWLCRVCHKDWHRINGPGTPPAHVLEVREQ